MVSSAVRKVMWVGRATVFMVGLAVILALVFGVATAALGAPPGSTFKLGQINTSNAVSALVGALPGSNLKIENTSTDPNAKALELKVAEGNAPLVVNSTAGKAFNLDADKVDGHEGHAAPLWAFINPDGTIERGFGVTSSVKREGVPTYDIEFNRPVVNCAYSATVSGERGSASATRAIFPGGETFENLVIVGTSNTSGPADMAFHLVVFC